VVGAVPKQYLTKMLNEHLKAASQPSEAAPAA
jgi:hypothetical protein